MIPLWVVFKCVYLPFFFKFFFLKIGTSVAKKKARKAASGNVRSTGMFRKLYFFFKTFFISYGFLIYFF